MVQSPIITSFKVVNNATAPIMVPWGRLNYSREMDGPFETEKFGENPKLGQSVELERKMWINFMNLVSATVPMDACALLL